MHLRLDINLILEKSPGGLTKTGEKICAFSKVIPKMYLIGINLSIVKQHYRCPHQKIRHRPKHNCHPVL